MPPRIQRRKVRDAINSEDHGFAIDHELALAQPPSSIDDPRIAIRPVMAVAGEEPNTVTVPLYDHAKPIVLDLVQPVRVSRDLGSSGRDTGFDDSGIRRI